MTCGPRPEAENTPRRPDLSPRLTAIERWLQHAEEELLYTPDAQGDTAALPLEARYYLCWGAHGMGVLAILRFPLDARHPGTQKSYGSYELGEAFPFTYQDQPYTGRVIERQISRVDGLVELHVQTTCEAEQAP